MIEAYKGNFESLELFGYEGEWLRNIFNIIPRTPTITHKEKLTTRLTKHQSQPLHMVYPKIPNAIP